MYNPYALEKMARDHHQELLSEAEDYRNARMATTESQSRANLLPRLLKIAQYPFFATKSRDADRVSFAPNEAKTSGTL